MMRTSVVLSLCAVSLVTGVLSSGRCHAAVDAQHCDELRAEAVTILKRLNAVIPRAEKWQLGENPDEACIALEFEQTT